MINILCVRWGDRYSSDYVDKLKQQVENNCSLDFKFFCLTDNPKHSYDIPLPKTWDKHYDPKRNGFWAYRKCYMFNEELFPQLDGDEFLYLDLDILIHSSIDSLFSLDMSQPLIIRGWWNDAITCIKNYAKIISTPINSSVIRWNRGQLKCVYKHIKKHTDYIFFTYPTIDNYFNHYWYDIHNEDDDKTKSSNSNKSLLKGFDKGIAYSWYKGNIFPNDMEYYKVRSENMFCLFNNSADDNTEDMYEIVKSWNI